MIRTMKVRNHPKVIDWPPTHGGVSDIAEGPVAAAQTVVRKVHLESIVDKSVPLSGEFRGSLFTYDVLTTDGDFAKRLAEKFSNHVGYTLEQLGDLEIGF
jgi:hypothetical protein